MDEQNNHSTETLNNQQLVLEETLNGCRRQLADQEMQYQRLSADFENYRRRVDQEKSRLSWEVRARVLRGALELVDTIDRASESLRGQQESKPESENFKELVKGIELLQKAAAKFIKQQGISSISQVQRFDPTMHESLAYGHDPQHEEGDILEIFEKGYLLDGELLRPARVKVNEALTNEQKSP